MCANYTDETAVRQQNALFTLANIPALNVAEFIANAQRNINSALGLSADMSAADIAASNVKTVANYHCAIDCCDYNPSLFANNAQYAMMVDAFHAKYINALNILSNWKGRAQGPSSFVPPTPE